ncbi:hypothetical protein N7468_001736 [Penicillium chermesinum]|uniref:Uncharacterized protein n=1 Tax=Penicillium chermesinum TaxID=63820 RepID=A0A9W9PH69_9EURO|nr:uncharacterized protein N7468_001736 [Penicillium chermesinum]KAJ5246753.1 hypothetical protein N7468_001736 [Penicillium chermesinum]
MACASGQDLVIDGVIYGCELNSLSRRGLMRSRKLDTAAFSATGVDQHTLGQVHPRFVLFSTSVRALFSSRHLVPTSAKFNLILVSTPCSAGATSRACLPSRISRSAKGLSIEGLRVKP